MDIENAMREGKLQFAKQGMFNVRTQLDFAEYGKKLPRATQWESHWAIYPYAADPRNPWNAGWCETEYKTHRNGKIKSLFFKDSNLKYKPHCIQRIFERNGFDPANLPKHIEQTDWIQYAPKGIVDGVERRFPIPFLDGLLIVSRRLGILGTHIKCHSQGIKSMDEPFGQHTYTAWTYIENLNEAQNTTLFYINNGQFEDAVNKADSWIKSPEEDWLKELL